MKAHAYSNATSADLWNALGAASGQDVGAIAAAWTERPGFPLVVVAAACDGNGKRMLTLSQRRFLLQGSDPASARWSVPLHIRSGAGGTPEPVLLAQDGQQVAAGRCDQALSVNADAVGYYRTLYDDATVQTDTAQFGKLGNGDRIALLDDQWALVDSGQQKLTSYLALASSMGDDLDERAWTEITGALGTIEVAERGTPGHEAFAAYARTILKPVADRLGWDAKPDDTPGLRNLRHAVLGDLGAWGDPTTVAEARKRFTAFAADRKTLAPDDQGVVLGIVARVADSALFDELHKVAKSAQNETEFTRYYQALMDVRDPALAVQAAKIALSAEVPPQAARNQIMLVAELEGENPQLAWSTFTDNVDALMLPQASFAPLIIAQFVPQIFWNAVSPDQLETWVKAHVPAEMADEVGRGIETARFKTAERLALTQAADLYLADRAAGGGKASGN